MSIDRAKLTHYLTEPGHEIRHRIFDYLIDHGFLAPNINDKVLEAGVKKAIETVKPCDEGLARFYKAFPEFALAKPDNVWTLEVQLNLGDTYREGHGDGLANELARHLMAHPDIWQATSQYNGIVIAGVKVTPKACSTHKDIDTTPRKRGFIK